MRKIRSLHKKQVVFILLLLVVLAILIWIFLPVRRDVCRRSVAWVECHTCYYLAAPCIDTLYFNQYDNEDSSFLNMSLSPRPSEETFRANGFWYQPFLWLNGGRLFTSAVVVPHDSLLLMFSKNPTAFMKRQLQQCKLQVSRLEHEENEYQYYMRTHSVQDEGYTLIAQYYSRLKMYHDTLIRISHKLESYSQLASASLRLQRWSRYSIRSMADSGLQTLSVNARLLGMDSAYGVALLQTDNEKLPKGAAVITGNLFDVLRLFYNHRPIRSATLVGFNRPADFALVDSIEPDYILGQLTSKDKNVVSHFPALSAIDGAPVFLSNGHLWGMFTSKRMIHYSDLNKIFWRLK